MLQAGLFLQLIQASGPKRSRRESEAYVRTLRDEQDDSVAQSRMLFYRDGSVVPLRRWGEKDTVLPRLPPEATQLEQCNLSQVPMLHA